MPQTQWKDLYFRHNFDDTGLYPTAGSLSASPDIIPAGGKPYSDPQQLIDTNNWKVSYGNQASANQPNYVYLRGQNLATVKTDGKIYLYATKASLILYPTNPVDPSKGWSQNPLKTSNGAEYIPVSPDANARFVTMEPFRWIPDNITGDHYCLIGRVVTEANPNPIPATGNLNDFGAYISNHPNMAWLNIALQNSGTTQWTSPPIEYEQGDIGGEVYVFLKCINAPDGSRVKFSTGTPGTNPPFAIDWMTVVNKPGKDGAPTFIAPLSVNIPANWHSNIVYTWDAAGKDPLPNMVISLEALLPVGGATSSWDASLAPFALPLEEIYGVTIPHKRWVAAEDWVGPTRAMVVGSHAMKGGKDLAGSNSTLQVGDALGVEATGGLAFSGTTWRTRTTSIQGSATSETDVTMKRSIDDKGTVTEAVRIAAGQGGDDESDLTFTVALSEPAPGGTTLFQLTTNDVPVGAIVWFKNVDGDTPIETPRTKVTKTTSFQVATLVSLDAEYKASIRVYLQLGGLSLPADYSMSFVAVLQVDPAGAEIIEVGPSKGKVLGKVVVAG